MSKSFTAILCVCLLLVFAGGCKEDCVCPTQRSPHIMAAPDELAFSAVGGGEPPPPQALAVANTGDGIVLWEISTEEDWIGFDPATGASAAGCGAGAAVSVRVTTADLPAGVYQGRLRVDGCPADNSPAFVSVTYTVSALDTAFSIEDAWWRDAVDADRDGYAESAALVWDPDVNDGTARTVSAQVFFRESCDGDWTYYATTPWMTISGDGDADTASVTVDHLAQGTYEFSIVLFERGRAPIVAARGLADDPDLGGRRFETIVAFTVFDAWWTGEIDNDGDGCRESGRLWWDVDVDVDDAYPVQAHVYCRLVGADAWTWYHSTPCWTVVGKSGADARSVEVAGLEPGRYEFIIDVYECDGHGKAAERSFAADADLADQCFDESFTISYAIVDAWWESDVDADGDGFSESRTLAWDPHIEGAAEGSVRELLYYRLPEDEHWTLLASTPCHDVTGNGTVDVFRWTVGGLDAGCYEFTIVLYECEGTDFVAWHGPLQDEDLAGQCFEPAAGP